MGTGWLETGLCDPSHVHVTLPPPSWYRSELVGRLCDMFLRSHSSLSFTGLYTHTSQPSPKGDLLF